MKNVSFHDRGQGENDHGLLDLSPIGRETKAQIANGKPIIYDIVFWLRPSRAHTDNAQSGMMFGSASCMSCAAQK
ncbi:hypothetical protein J6590_017652 [Homalodisca vitripennis]|nr:hypothetical protein J6590_017652 [Homalodisca vitripennis]